jgi:hypothetical protein
MKTSPTKILVDVNSAPVLKLTKFTAVLAKNTDNHGIIFKIEAKKPAGSHVIISNVVLTF